MKAILLFLILSFNYTFVYSQENSITYDKVLAESLQADEYGMKQYVFCLLKTGTNTTATKEETQKSFEGHMANINKLAKEGKLIIAGPFIKNNRNYRGIYIFNTASIEEALELVKTDPAISSNLLEAELSLWYGSAALQETNKIHEKIAKNKF